MNPDSLHIRPISPDDSLVELTELIRSAYARLAALGMNFLGTYQTVEMTARRVASGLCSIAEMGGRVVGTVTLYVNPRPGDPPLYREPDVASFGQLAVAPDLQRQGIGERLIEHAAELARAYGCSRLALDTAENADHLIRYYQRLGFTHAGYQDWPDTNYISVLMTRDL